MSQRLLEGEYVESANQEDALRAEIRSLQTKLAHAELDVRNARDKAALSVGELRRLLLPFHRALQMVFDEVEAMGITDTSKPSSTTQNTEVWEAWKSRLGQNCSRVIDALLKHGTLNTTQLSIATGITRNNIPNSIHKLNKASLINKIGGNFSLKQL